MDVTVVYGLVPQDQVEHLRRALAVAGVSDDDLEVRPAAPGRYELHDESLHQDAAGARHGLLAGTLIGALLGLAIGLLVPQITGMLAIVTTASAMAGFGAIVGAMTGLQRADSNDADPVSYREVTADAPFALVAVHDEHWHYRAHRIMEQHGAVFVEEARPVGTADADQPVS